MRRPWSPALLAVVACLALPTEPHAVTLGDGVRIAVTGHVAYLDGVRRPFDYEIGYDGVTAGEGVVVDTPVAAFALFGVPAGGSIAELDLTLDIAISSPGLESVFLDFTIDHHEGGCYFFGDFQSCIGHNNGTRSVYMSRTITEDAVVRTVFRSDGVTSIPPDDSGDIDFGYVFSHGWPITIRIDADLAAERRAAAAPQAFALDPFAPLTPVPLPAPGLLLVAALPLLAFAARRRRAAA